MRNNHANTRQGVRRGEEISGKTFMSGPLTEEESKNPDVVHLTLAHYIKGAAKNTIFFTTYEPEYVFKQIISKLEDKDITPEVSHKKWKLTYNKIQELDDD